MSARWSYPFVWLGVPLVLIILFAAGPLIALFIAGGIADALGCTVPVAALPPCPFMGHDLADTLAIMVFLGYLAFWTLPMGGTALAIWLVIACIVTAIWWWRRQRQA
jgi:hypothetical protein